MARLIWNPLQPSKASVRHWLTGRLETSCFRWITPLQGWQRKDVDEETSLEILKGHDWQSNTEGLSLDKPLCMYGPGGKFLAVMRYDAETSVWKPDKVFHL